MLPAALPGILTGTILALSRAIGEAAPMILVGAAAFIAFDPSGLSSSFTVLPIQIFNWTAQPRREFREIAAAGIIVLHRRVADPEPRGDPPPQQVHQKVVMA